MVVSSFLYDGERTFFYYKKGELKMKQLKRESLLVAAAVLITLAACSNTSSTEDTQSGENSVDAVEEKVVEWHLDHMGIW